VLSALSHESAPLVQVAMIELLAPWRDQSARPVLEKLSRDEVLDRNVRETARRALAVLGLPADLRNSPAATLKKNPEPALT
jgi:hypothetical protein